MNQNELLIRTLDDLSYKINSFDEYEVLLSSALIRKLFLDDHPLIDLVNKNYRLKFEFEYAEIKPPSIRSLASPSFWSIIVGLDPMFAPLGAKIIKTNRDKFFSTIIGIAENQEYTIKDLIKFVANNIGGVHVGKPNTKLEEAILKLHEQKTFLDISGPLQQIKSIAKIILRTLKPLKYQILNLERFEDLIGFSLHISVTIFKSKENKNNFIFDLGVEKNRNRLSIYVNNNDELYFQLIDALGNIYSIKSGHSGSTFVYGIPTYISFQLTCLGNETMLSIETGAWNLVKIYSTQIQMNFLKDHHFVYGSNYNGTELTNMELNQVLLYERILKFEEKEKLYDYLMSDIKRGFTPAIRYQGNQFLHSVNHPNFK